MISDLDKYTYFRSECSRLLKWAQQFNQSVLALLLPGSSPSPSTGVSVVSLCSWLPRKAPCQPCSTARLTISLNSASGSVPFLSCRSMISFVWDIRSSDNCDVICSAWYSDGTPPASTDSSTRKLGFSAAPSDPSNND